MNSALAKQNATLLKKLRNLQQKNQELLKNDLVREKKLQRFVRDVEQIAEIADYVCNTKYSNSFLSAIKEIASGLINYASNEQTNFTLITDLSLSATSDSRALIPFTDDNDQLFEPTPTETDLNNVITRRRAPISNVTNLKNVATPRRGPIKDVTNSRSNSTRRRAPMIDVTNPKNDNTRRRAPVVDETNPKNVTKRRRASITEVTNAENVTAGPRGRASKPRANKNSTKTENPPSIADETKENAPMDERCTRLRLRPNVCYTEPNLIKKMRRT